MGSRYEQLLFRGEIREVLLQHEEHLLVHAASGPSPAATAQYNTL